MTDDMQKVDVLAVMRAAEKELRHWQRDHGHDIRTDEAIAGLRFASNAVAELIKCQRESLALLEEWAEKIDSEWGVCRDLGELEADGELAPEIIRARNALARIGSDA